VRLGIRRSLDDVALATPDQKKYPADTHMALYFVFTSLSKYNTCIVPHEIPETLLNFMEHLSSDKSNYFVGT
jgi:hypothetical protein